MKNLRKYFIEEFNPNRALQLTSIQRLKCNVNFTFVLYEQYFAQHGKGPAFSNRKTTAQAYVLIRYCKPNLPFKTYGKIWSKHSH